MTDLRSRMTDDPPALGTFVMLMSPNVVEVLGTLVPRGLSWVAVDAQHQALNAETLADVVKTAELFGLSCLVRVGVGDTTTAELALDLGAEGVIFPVVGSADDARAAVAACRYPPEGTRSIGGLRRLLRPDDRTPLCVIQIESEGGVDALDEILAVDGIDAVFPGKVDLGRSLGLAERYADPDARAAALSDAIDAIERRAAERGIASMRHCETVEAARRAVDAGCSLITLGSDMGFLVASGGALLAGV